MHRHPFQVVSLCRCEKLLLQAGGGGATSSSLNDKVTILEQPVFCEVGVRPHVRVRAPTIVVAAGTSLVWPASPHLNMFPCVRACVVVQAAFHWTSPVSSRSLVSKSLAKAVDNIVQNKVQRATGGGGGDGAAGPGSSSSSSSSPAPDKRQSVRAATASTLEDPKDDQSATRSRLDVLLQPKILGILEVDVARLDKLG